MQIWLKPIASICLASLMLIGCNAHSVMPTTTVLISAVRASHTPAAITITNAIPTAQPLAAVKPAESSDWLTYTHPFGLSFRYPASWKLEAKNGVAYQGFRMWAGGPDVAGQWIFVYFGSRRDWETEKQGRLSLFDPQAYLRWAREIKRPSMRGVKFVLGPDEQGMILPELPAGQTFKAILLNTAPNANESGYYMTIETRISPEDQVYAEQVGLDRVIQERYRTFETIVDSARFPEENGATVTTPETQSTEPSIYQYEKMLIISGTRQIDFPHHVMGVKISPSNRWFAVYTSEYYKTTPGQQTLYLYSFPDGKLQWQQSLLSPYLATSAASITITDRSTVGDVYHSILQASSEQNWSPDSRYFAFASAHEGQSADLYVFDTQRLTTTRLTDGPAQIGDIQWSPDSQWVLHQGVVSFDTGNTWIVDAFWAASVNGEVRLLAHDAQRSLYRRVTWLSDQEFLAVTQRPTGNNALLYISIADPSNNLQLFDIPGFISNVRYHPDTRQIDVVVFDPDSGTLQHVQRWALWSVFMDGRVPQKLKETENQEITLP